MTDRVHPRLMLLALAGLWLAWGYNFLVIKLALAFIGPFQFALWRTVLSFAVLLAWLHASGRLQLPRRHLGLLALLGILQTGGFTGFTCLALVGSGTGKTALLAFTSPVWAGLLAAFLLREKPAPVQALACALAAAGILLLVPWRGEVELAHYYALAAGLSLGASSVVLKLLYARGENDLIHLTAWQMLPGCLPLLAGALLIEDKPAQMHAALAFGLAYNVASTAFGWTIWAWLLQRMPATVANMNALMVPVIGLAAGYVHLGERWAPGEATGIGLVLAGIALTWAGAWIKPALKRVVALAPRRH